MSLVSIFFDRIHTEEFPELYEPGMTYYGILVVRVDENGEILEVQDAKSFKVPSSCPPIKLRGPWER